MASVNPTSSSSHSADENIMWEYGDDYTDFDIHYDIDSPITSAPISPTSSQPTTPGLISMLTTMSIASKETFFPVSSSTPIRKFGRPFKVK